MCLPSVTNNNNVTDTDEMFVLKCKNYLASVVKRNLIFVSSLFGNFISHSLLHPRRRSERKSNTTYVKKGVRFNEKCFISKLTLTRGKGSNVTA